MSAAISNVENYSYERERHRRRKMATFRLSDFDLQARLSAAPPTPLISESRRWGWLPAVVGRLEELQEFGPNWDTYGGRPIARDTTNFTLKLLQEIVLEDTPVPSIVPLSYGGIQLEWHQDGIDMEIAVHGPNDISVRYFDGWQNARLETDIAAEFSELIGPIRTLTERAR